MIARVARLVPGELKLGLATVGSVGGTREAAAWEAVVSPVEWIVVCFTVGVKLSFITRLTLLKLLVLKAKDIIFVMNCVPCYI